MGWLSDWAKRIELTGDNTNVDSDLSDFPVLFYISAASGIGDEDASAVFDELVSDANRKKIAVTTSDGETQCYVEIERWDDANEKAWLWVQVPSVTAASTTTLYLYYDSSKDDNTSYIGDITDTPSKSVWDSDFVFVCHMAQDPSGGADCIKDSTSNEHHGTPDVSMTSEDLVDGLIGKAIDFDGNDDIINHGSAATLADIPIKTIELLINLDAQTGTNSWCHFINKGSWFLSTEPDSSRNVFGHNFSTTIGRWSYSQFSLSVYHHLVAVYDRQLTTNNPVIYLDSVSQGITEYYTPEGSAVSDASDSLCIGNRPAQDRGSDAKICEVRISKVARSAAWIKATYHSNYDNLVTWGSEETIYTTIAVDPIDIGLSLNDTDVISIGQSRYKQDPWVLDALHYGKENAKSVAIGDRSGNGIWGFVKQEEKPRYNEGDEIETSASPLFDIEFTKIPITPTHKPCGYWHSTPDNMIPGDPPSIYADKCDDSQMAWDSTTSAATIGRDDYVVIAITDDGVSGSPYVWKLDAQSISNGFSLSHSKTLGLTNALHSDSGACGACLIMVAGCDGLGTTVMAYVRCTWGEWGSYITVCTESSGLASVCSPLYICEEIDSNDNHKQNYSCLGCVCPDCPCEGTQTCDPPYWPPCWPPCSLVSCQCGPPPDRCSEVSGNIGVGQSKYRYWGC